MTELKLAGTVVLPEVAGQLVVVTGGAGFIGSNLARALAALGARVVACDRLRCGDKWRNLSGVALHDLIRPEDLFAFLHQHRSQLKAVIHMGAISATTESDVDRIVANNVRLTLDLWRWCGEHRVRLIYASSAATYGDGSAGFADDEAPAALARLTPLNAYGWSKHLIDRRLLADVEAGQPSPPQWAGLKFFNVYGPHEGHKGEMKSVIAKIHPLVRRGEGVTLFKSHHPDYADGGQSRDFVYVKDCVAFVLWLLATPGVSGLFNVGSGRARSFLDLALAVFAVAGRSPDIRFIDTPAEIRDKYQYFTEADMSKARARGFSREFYRLEDGIRDYIESFLALG